MVGRSKSRAGWLTWALVATALTVLCVVWTVSLLSARAGDRSLSFEEQKERTDRGAAVLEEVADELVGAVDRAASRIDRLDLTPRIAPSGGEQELIESALLDAVERAPGVNGVLFAAAPSGPAPDCGGAAEPDGDGFYEPYATRRSGPLRVLPLHETLSLDYRCRDWWRAALNAEPDAAWTPPRVGAVSNTTLAFHSVTVRSDDDRLVGIVLGTTVIDNLTSRLNWERSSPFGYTYVEASDGSIASHPWGSVRANVCDEGRAEDHQRRLCEVVSDPRPDPGGISKDPVTGSDVRVVAREVAGPRWTLVNVEVVDERPVDGSASRLLSGIGIGGLFAAFAGVAVWSADRHGGWGNPWVLSAGLSIALFAGVGWMWWVEATAPQPEQIQPGTELTEFDVAEGREPVEVGVFIQSLEFLEANEIAVSGLIWQSGDPVFAAKPPVFAEATSPATMELLWGADGEREHGWQFSASLRQEFNYGKYPLDQEHVWLRLWSNPADQTTLVPDLDSLVVAAPSSQPGLADGLVLEGWSIERSYFTRDVSPVNTEIGGFSIAPGPLEPGVPQLLFVVDLQRDFSGPFVSQLIPLIAVNLLLFGVLLHLRTVLNDTTSITDPMTMLAYLAALFFVVVVSHNELRTRLGASELVYLENFYFTTYLMLLLVAINSLVLSSGESGAHDWLARGRNISARLAYWPIFGVLTLAATLRAFL